MKLLVTPELAALIKTLRTQRGIPSKDLADKIKRSPSYVTKLEKGEVKNIQKELLMEVFENLTEEADYTGEGFQNMLLLLSTVLGSEDIFSQKWLVQLDLFERTIRIPGELAENIEGRLKALGLDRQQFLDILNANKDLNDPKKYPVNEVSLVDSPEGNLFRLRMHIDKEALDQLLDKNDLATNYATIYSILFTLIKLEKWGDVGHMEPDAARQVLEEVYLELAAHEIYSISRFGQVLASGSFQTNQLMRLGKSVPADPDTVNGILEVFKDMGAYDPEHTREHLLKFHRNLEWDPAFMLQIMGLEFSRLQGLSFSNKRDLLEEIGALIRRYDEMPEVEKRMERY